MAQYINKNALIVEIEKKIKQYEDAFNNPSFASYEASLIAKGKYRKLLDIIQFINTLEVKVVQEETVSEDLEEASRNYADNEEYGDDVYFAIKAAFKAGAKWQKEKDSILPKVWNREKLDEFSYQTAYDLSNDWMKETPTWDDVEIACKLGAKWKEEQL